MSILSILTNTCYERKICDYLEDIGFKRNKVLWLMKINPTVKFNNFPPNAITILVYYKNTFKQSMSWNTL